jgi:hypothetical protein
MHDFLGKDEKVLETQTIRAPEAVEIQSPKPSLRPCNLKKKLKVFYINHHNVGII